VIRVLVVEDSPTARGLLVMALSSDPEIEVVGQASTGEDAVRKTAELRPDLVTMDIHLPGIDGFEATSRIMQETPTPIVIVSGLDVGDMSVSMNALCAGALAVLAKPVGPADPRYRESAAEMTATVRAMAAVKLASGADAPGTMRSADPGMGLAAVAGPPIAAVGLAASAGGAAALHRILSDIPVGFPAPILIVQQMADDFRGGFVDWLSSGTAMRVKLAEPGEPLVAGTAFLAPDARHLVADGGIVGLLDEPPVDGASPSATVLFRSLARTFGARAAGVVLTGTGRDGIAGLRELREAGGRVLAQDAESSLVAETATAAIEAQLPHAVLRSDDIGAALNELARRSPA
jgi:two-component system, chemotaxis family, protein-glutamate methylesterase/glutaminase